MARWPATKHNSYGFGRVEVLSGFINALFLNVIAVFILMEAWGRIWDPPTVNTDRLLVVAVCGLCVNLFGMYSFHGGEEGHGHSHHGHSHGGGAHGHSHGGTNANMQGVFLHVLADTLGSVFVIISTFLMEWFGWQWVDPLCSFILSLILGSVYPLLRSSACTLLQEILCLEGVLSFSSPHIWQLKSDLNVASLHVQVTNDANIQSIRHKIALEEAVKLKEKKAATEVVAFSMGGPKCQEVLRTALAKGADKAIHIEIADADASKLEPLHVARALKKIMENDKFDAVFLGKQAIDDDANQTGSLLPGMLDWPQALYASKVEPDGKHLKVTREIDGGLDTIKVTLPAVLSADLRLNEPRYATFPNIMKAKKKPLERKSAKDLGIDMTPQTKVLEVSEPPVRQAGGFVDDVSALISKLEEKGFIKA